MAPTSSEIDLGVVVDVAPNLHIGHDGKGLKGDRFIVEMEKGKKVTIDNDVIAGDENDNHNDAECKMIMLPRTCRADDQGGRLQTSWGRQ